MSSPSLPPPPVLHVFPAEVTFYSGDVASFKRVITVYNPYDVDVKFKGEIERTQIPSFFFASRTDKEGRKQGPGIFLAEEGRK